MHTEYMKLLFSVILVLLFVLSWLIISPANVSRNCYITTQKELDASAFQVQANPNVKEIQCMSTYNTITALGVCVDASHSRIPLWIRPQLSRVADQLVLWIRYQSKDIAQLRQEHDIECAEYIDTMFVPPDLTQ